MHNIYRQLANMGTWAAMAVLVSFMAISIAGLGMGMQMEQGMMTDCVFMAGDQDTWCPMLIQDHIRQWKSLLTGVPLSIIMLLVVSALMGARVIGREDQEAIMRFRLHERIKKRRLFSLFEYLRRIFSQGILNPKIYFA